LIVDPDQPLVSVVIIFLNEERYLLQAIDSVRIQDYTNWELILVDDGSTDGSRAIAEAAQASAPERIRYVQHPGGENKGMGKSRNLGMSFASGRYISFLDADDFFLPSKLSIQVKLLQSHPDVAATSGRYLLLFSDEREYDVNHQLQDLSDLPGHTIKGLDLIWRMNAEEALTPQHGAMLIRLEAARVVGGFTDQFQGIYEDGVFFTKLLATKAVYISNDCVTVYRMHWDSFCHRAMERGDYPDTPLKSIRYEYNVWLLSYLRAVNGRWRLMALVRIELLSHKFRALFPLLKRVNRWIVLCDRRLIDRRRAEQGLRGHDLQAEQQRKSNEFLATIAEVARFYRSTERADELEQLRQRMQRFMSPEDLAGLDA
jgi:glycosyltransferase involved in cell wall biosynthesis